MTKPQACSNLVDHLRQRVELHPDQPAFGFLDDGENESGWLDYKQLDRQARNIAAMLQSAGLAGERTLLLLPPGLELIVTIFGCLYAGTIPVATVIPSQHKKGTLDRLHSIAADARPRAVVTTPALKEVWSSQMSGVAGFAGVRWLTSDDVDPAGAWRDPGLSGDNIAFLQYTSGSTASPRGVMVSHGNLIHNAEELSRAMDNEGKTAVSWLPLHHDMGLVGVVLQAAFSGMRGVLMPPLLFLQKPVRWLQAISHYRGHTSGGPNFAYELCVQRTTPEQCEGLDLSCWRVAFNGSEPVRASTLARFAEKFRPWGFRAESLYPCYGLAEATLFVSGKTIDQLPVTRSYDSAALQQGRVVPVPQGAGAQVLVSSGRSYGQEMVIADPESRNRQPPGLIGEIWLAGGNVAQGYWELPQDSETNFRARLAGEPDTGPFLRTGDLGFIEDDNIFITGRCKDLIIISGSNHYPQDIEQTVEEGEVGVRVGGCAAFSVDVDDEERLVLVAELRDGSDIAATTKSIRRLIAQQHDLRVDAVTLISPGSLPRTTSGKVRRHVCKAAYLGGTLADSMLAGEG